MAEDKHFYLCGGVLFFLLIQATQQNGSARDHRNGIKDDHSAPILMSDLIYTFTGSHNYGAEKDTSQYRECLSEGSINVPFNDIAKAAAYNTTVTEKYPDALKRISEFVKWHIDLGMKDWLVKALLDVIKDDSGIEENDSLYIRSDGLPVTKANIRTLGSFELQPFLVGVLHYIVYRRHGCNMRGAETLDMIGTKKARKERVYEGHLGENLSRPVSVDLYTPPVLVETIVLEHFDESPADAEKSDRDVLTDGLMQSAKIIADGFGKAEHPLAEQIREKQKEADSSREETEYTEAKVEGDHDESSGAADEGKKITVIQQQTNVVQNGDRNVNVTNNGTMNFNF